MLDGEPEWLVLKSGFVWGGVRELAYAISGFVTGRRRRRRR